MIDVSKIAEPHSLGQDVERFGSISRPARSMVMSSLLFDVAFSYDVSSEIRCREQSLDANVDHIPACPFWCAKQYRHRACMALCLLLCLVNEGVAHFVFGQATARMSTWMSTIGSIALATYSSKSSRSSAPYVSQVERENRQHRGINVVDALWTEADCQHAVDSHGRA